MCKMHVRGYVIPAWLASEQPPQPSVLNSAVINAGRSADGQISINIIDFSKFCAKLINII